jgi:Ca2+-binding RTX toxin-like protein
MPTITNYLGLTFDLTASSANNWLRNILAVGNHGTPTVTAKTVTFVANQSSAFAGYTVTLDAESTFISSASSPGFTGDISGVGLIDPQGNVVASVTDLYPNTSFNGLLGDLLWGVGADFGGSTGADHFIGAGGPDDMTGGYGDDWLEGAAGDDWLEGGLGNDRLDGGAGIDFLVGGPGVDVLNGGDGDDDIVGGDGADTIDGGAGIDYLFIDAPGFADIVIGPATPGTGQISVSNIELILLNDFGSRVVGGAGVDAVLGGLGADEIHGGGGDDIISGLDGNDSVYGDSGDDLIGADLGDDLIDGGDGVDALDMSNATGSLNIDLRITTGQRSSLGLDIIKNIESLYGSDQADTLTGNLQANALDGGNGGDHLVGLAGDDMLVGGAGDDWLDGGLGADKLDGGDGIDLVTYASAAAGITAYLGGASLNAGEAAGDTYVDVENLEGSAFADVLGGTDLANALLGLSGNDFLYGGGGDDTLSGGLGGDLLDGGAGADFASYAGAAAGVTVFLGGPYLNAGEAVGDSYAAIEGVIGSAYADLIGGTNAADALRGEAGNDWLIGAAGGDWLDGGAGNDVLEGGAGADVMAAGAGDDVASYRQATAGVTASFSTSSSNAGEAAGDVYFDVENLWGSDFADTLGGNDASGQVYGFGGADTLNGLGGDDALYGGDGADAISGGTGADTFFFLQSSEGGDTITDFVSGQDRVFFSEYWFGLPIAPAGSISASRFVSGDHPAAAGPGASFLFDTASHQLLFDPDGSGAQAAILMATFSNGVNLTAGDIWAA